ncbi:MAG: UDP-3-O-(3-hydroxymyristoyl)glucosamine N-acyltransferase [Rikenellaceae bacterium]
MQFTAEIIASFLEGEVVGDKNATVTTVAKIEEGTADTLSFLSNPKYEHFIYTTQSSIVIVKSDFAPTAQISATLIKVEDPYASFAKLLELYAASKPQKEGVSYHCVVAEGVVLPDDIYIGEYASIGTGVLLGENVKIYPHVVIGDKVVIGDNTTIFPHVTIYEECKIGNRTTIHSGTVIGSDGFGFAPEGDKYNKIPQIGNVIIEDDVEIGSNCSIDRATMGSTIIKKGTKLDNLIQVAHNVVIGENCVAASQVGIAGSTTIGHNSIFGGQVGISGHLKIAPRTTISSQSGISNSVKNDGSILMGTPAFDAGKYRRSAAIFKSLPTLSQKVYALEKELQELKELLNRQ